MTIKGKGEVDRERERSSMGGSWVRSRQCWGAISEVLQAAQSQRCFKQRDLTGAGMQRDWCDLGLGAVVRFGVGGCGALGGAISFCSFSLFYFPSLEIILR